MATVRLSGTLVCRDLGDVAIIESHLPRHVALTRAEPGCVSFDVVRGDDPLVWHVEELFSDVVAFRAHQERVAASEWGRATGALERRYVTKGLPPADE